MRGYKPRPLGIAAILLVLGVLGFALVGLALSTKGPGELAPTGAGKTQQLLGGLEQKGARLGDPSAPVTIQVYNDPQCGSCDDWQLETIPPLVNDYVRPGDVQLVYRHFAMGETDTTLADYGVAAAAKQDYGWQFLQLFYINQDAIPHGKVTEDVLSRIASAIGFEFDLVEWRDDYEDKDSLTPLLTADNDLAIQLRLPAEPAVVIDGPGGTRKLEESPSLDDIEAAIQEVS